MNIDRLREKTPGCNNVIHFNNAGASLVSKKVLEAQVDYLEEEAKLGGYELAAKREKDLESLYSEIAWLINAKREEIAFTESATVAWLRSF